MALEMVLNELSLQPADDVYTARQRMGDFIQTIRAATAHRVSRVLRTQSDIFDVVLAENYPMRRWLNDREVDRVARLYIKTLAVKAPFWDGLADLYDEVLESEFSYDGQVAHGLGVTYLLDALAVSFASEACWDVAKLSLNACCLMDDGRIEQEIVSIIHASCPEHVNEHEGWIQEHLRGDIQDGADLWKRREELLPHLAFCEKTERQLQDLSTTMLQPVVNRLFKLETYSQGWTEGPFRAAQLSCKATPESSATLEQYNARRTFRCPDGTERLFSWHIRVTPRNYRIYFDPEPGTGTMIIGYIGPKLPTVRYPTV